MNGHRNDPDIVVKRKSSFFQESNPELPSLSADAPVPTHKTNQIFWNEKPRTDML
jgi:hypothetical protein